MNKCVIVRGGGDIATGTIYKLVKSGFQVLVIEAEKPSAIRRNVAFCQAVEEMLPFVRLCMKENLRLKI